MKSKKILTCFALVVALTPMFAGCKNAPVPTIKEGKFNFSVTYELGGEVKTISSVYVCKYVESGMYLDGWYIDWEAYVEDSEIQALIEDESYYFGIMLENNEDGAIHLDLNLNPEYFMSEPMEDGMTAAPYLFIRYNDAVAEEKGIYLEDDLAVLESYGAKLISYEYDSPIENIYK